MDNQFVDRKALAASLLGCQPEELLGFRDEGLAGVVLIAPDGRKHRFPEELLRRAQAWLVEIPSEQDVGRLSKASVEDGRMANSVRPESRPTPEEFVGQLSQPAGNNGSVGRVSKPAVESRPTRKSPRSKKGPHP